MVSLQIGSRAVIYCGVTAQIVGFPELSENLAGTDRSKLQLEYSQLKFRNTRRSIVRPQQFTLQTVVHYFISKATNLPVSCRSPCQWC